MTLKIYKKYAKYFLLITLILSINFNKYLYADDAPLQIDIFGGRVQAMPIAISYFSKDKNLNSNNQLEEKIPDLISNNLINSGLFKLLDRNAYMQKPSQLNDKPPKFRDWRIIDAQVLITGNIEKRDDNKKIGKLENDLSIKE